MSQSSHVNRIVRFLLLIELHAVGQWLQSGRFIEQISKLSSIFWSVISLTPDWMISEIYALYLLPTTHYTSLPVHFYKRRSQLEDWINSFFQWLREKCPYSKFFWSAFSPNAGKYGPEKLRMRQLFTKWYKLVQTIVFDFVGATQQMYNFAKPEKTKIEKLFQVLAKCLNNTFKGCVFVC